VFHSCPGLWRFEKTQQISSPFQEEETGIPAICCIKAVKIFLQANSVGLTAVVLVRFVPAGENPSSTRQCGG
jgi:hypothetical protein